MNESTHEFEGLESVDDRSVVGRRIIWLKETLSTNDDVRQEAEAEEPEGLVIVADLQNAGRGRMSRTWTSPPGMDILFSVLLRPGAADLPKMPLISGLAVARTLDAFTDTPITLKWPNDVRAADRKISGSLVESGSSDTGYYAVLGTGVNINQDASGHPEIAEIATSLRTLNGISVSRRDVMRKLLLEMDNISQVQRTWRPSSLTGVHGWRPSGRRSTCAGATRLSTAWLKGWTVPDVSCCVTIMVKCTGSRPVK